MHKGVVARLEPSLRVYDLPVGCRLCDLEFGVESSEGFGACPASLEKKKLLPGRTTEKKS